MLQNKFFMKKKNTAEKQLANIEEGLSKTEQFIEDNSRVLFIIIGLIVFIFIGYYGYKNLYEKPLNKKAQKQLFIAEQYFEKDSFETALNGTDLFDGLISIIDQYSSTTSGSLAKYYAGICYLNIGDYKNAINYFIEVLRVNPNYYLAYFRMAICYQGLGDVVNSEQYYRKALGINPNFKEANDRLNKLLLDNKKYK